MKRTPLKRTGRIKPKRKTAEDFGRVYGSKDRVEFVKGLACVSCGRGPCENAHIRSGGMGRKADFRDIVPLCQTCHRLQHQRGWKALGLNASKLQFLAFQVQFQWAKTQGLMPNETDA